MSAVISFGLLWFMLGIVNNLEIKLLMGVVFSLLYMILLLPLKFYKVVDIKILEFFANRIPFMNRILMKLRTLLVKFV